MVWNPEFILTRHSVFMQLATLTDVRLIRAKANRIRPTLHLARFITKIYQSQSPDPTPFPLKFISLRQGELRVRAGLGKLLHADLHQLL